MDCESAKASSPVAAQAVHKMREPSPVRGDGELHTLEARVSAQLRLLLGDSPAAAGETKEAMLADLGCALAVLDHAMRPSQVARAQ